MELIFLALFLVGAVGIQLGNGLLSKGEFTPMSFLTLLPLLSGVAAVLSVMGGK